MHRLCAGQARSGGKSVTMGSMNEAILLIPGLFPLIPDKDVPRLPHLEWVLAHGDCTLSTPARLLEQVQVALAATCRLPVLSLARTCATQAGLATHAPGWLCADPVHLQVEGDALLLVQRYGFSVQEEEAQLLLQSLNQHFAQEGLVFYALNPSRWLVGCALPPEIKTTHPLLRVGRNIDGYLPQGLQARRWRALFNEVQMLFHDHPVNLARQARGERTLSGVWFWDTEIAELESQARLMEDLRSPSAYGDVQGWQEAAVQLDDTVMRPLLAQLRRGQLQRLTVLGMEGRCDCTLVLQPAHGWRFWRRRRPLCQIPGVPALTHR